MADSVGMAEIRGIDIDKIAKGYGKLKYNFIEECQIVKFNGDKKIWFSKTAGTLTATSPSATKNVSPGSRPTTLEVSWTRNESYSKKFFVEGFLTEEDINDSEVDVLVQTIKDLTEVILRDRDEFIFNVMSEDLSPTNIQSFAVTSIGGANWDAANYAADIVKDLQYGKRLLRLQGYEANGASLLVSPKDYDSIINWLISGKGSSIPGFSSEKIKSGVVLQLLNLNIKVSNNVPDDYALMVVPKTATTYAENQPITARIIKDEGIGRNIRVWARGTAYNTDPKAIVLIRDTQA